MKAEKFIYEKHADEVKRWLIKHSFPFPPEEYLPNIGFIVDGAACGFLYTSNSKMGWIEWVFSNPEKTKSERYGGLDTVIGLLEMTAKELGIWAVFAASGVEAKSKVLARNGFERTDDHVSHFIKIFEGRK